jgi:hypothetical protein
MAWYNLMPAMAVVQPNGLYARFSSIVDDFTHTNLTRDEIWTEFQHECGDDCADGKLERAHKDLGRFEECMEDILRVHGAARAKQTKASCSVKKTVSPKGLTNLQRQIIEGKLTQPIITAARMLAMIELCKVGGTDLNDIIWDNDAMSFVKVK